MTIAEANQALLAPFRLGKLPLRNRVVMAPMTREASRDGVPTKSMIDYYARRAAGGVGLIITEGTTVPHVAARNRVGVPVFHGVESLEQWAKLAATVRAEGAAIMPQLWHVGMDRKTGDPPDPTVPPAGPSGIDLNGTKVGRPMTRNEIDDVIQAFAAAARDAERIGFDGIELHGAHGYLIDQFLWSRTNQRTDEYGGDIVRRTQFAADLVRACRSAVSAEFPIIFRLSQWKISDLTARLTESPAELEQVVSLLADAGVDAFHCSTRRYWLPGFAGLPLTLAGWVRRITGLPTIGVGSVGLRNSEFTATLLHGMGAEVDGLAGVADHLNRGEFDLVCVGRALISEPSWVNKIAQGRSDELRPFNAGDLARLY
ncbi:NADH:flavin oxidoreductase [Actinoplanes sp. TFC3]|uniref:NADH:flavin oxidoreductase n=1 Tax=Actinoplanes sp. TFC3 TaxID=1710355 RepID=UPI0008375849|nr:NADH:flavin oxidoreductase [Actinoplanes sp. TFC3]